jgi:hypothetical protein
VLKQKLHLWIPKNLFKISLLCFITACAAKSNQVIWPENQQRLADLSVCRARALVEVTNKNESASIEMVFRYIRHSKSPQLEALFYGPLKQAIGRLSLSSQERVWRGAEESEESSIVNQLIAKEWTTDFDFILGIIDGRSSSASVWMDLEGLPRRLERSGRTTNCFYERNNRHPTRCILGFKDLRATVNFTSVRCEDSL